MMDQNSASKVIKNKADYIYGNGTIPTVANIKRALDKEYDETDIAFFLREWEAERLKGLLNGQQDNTDQVLSNFIEEHLHGLENSMALVRATLESTGDGILVVSSEGRMLDYNDKFLEMWHMPRQVMEQRNDEVALKYVMEQLQDPHAFVQTVQNEYQNIQAKGAFSDLHFKDGRIFERYSQPYTINNEICGRVWSLRDVSERRKAEKNLRILQRAIESAKEATIITDNSPNPKIIYANKALKDITGFIDEDVIDMHLYDILQIDDEKKYMVGLQDAFLNEKTKTVELTCQRKNKETYWCELSLTAVEDEKNNVQYFIAILTDITDRKNIEQQLVHQATHDALTELPNRTIIFDRIAQSIIYAEISDEYVGVMFVDVDNFKLVNDSLGHSVGDLVLKQIAKRLKEITFNVDTVGRLSGDEFIIIIPSVKTESSLIIIAQKIMSVLSQPFLINGYEHYLTVSVGISCYPKDGNEPEALISNADTAMYQAKEAGRNSFSFFTQSMNEKVQERIKIQNGLSRAIEKNELKLVYQPIVNLHTNKIESAEALLRWQFQNTENIPPALFIPIAEETGQILPLGDFAIQEACKMSTRLIQADIPIYLAINISIRQLNHENFIKTIKDFFNQYAISPHLIIMELTESMLIQSAKGMLKKISALKELGVQLAIDDFGTGYSSLSYLKELSVDKLKIDKSFIDGFPDKKYCLDIVSIIISLAKTFQLKTVAEGVETKEQLTALIDLGCDEVQGYYFSKPLPEEDFFKFVNDFNRDPQPLGHSQQ